MATPPPVRPSAEQCRDTEDCRNSDVELRLDHAATDLTRRFDGTFAYETVLRLIGESYERLAVTARIHTRLPVLACPIPFSPVARH